MYFIFGTFLAMTFVVVVDLFNKYSIWVQEWIHWFLIPHFYKGIFLSTSWFLKVSLELLEHCYFQLELENIFDIFQTIYLNKDANKYITLKKNINGKWSFWTTGNDISRTMQNYSLLIFSFSFLATGKFSLNSYVVLLISLLNFLTMIQLIYYFHLEF